MNKERLIQMAEHLESGKLGHEVFDFSTVNDIFLPKCGTAGCAIGELPIIWPNNWKWSISGSISFIDKHYDDLDECVDECVGEWFDLDEFMVYHLFYPENQKVRVFGGVELTESATRYDVAANIRAFITKMENS